MYNHFCSSTPCYEGMYVMCPFTCWIHNRMAIGSRLDMAAKRERERERERDICPHLNMNLNRTFSMWPVLIMTSDCTMPGHEEQVTNFAFHEHFSFFFRY